MHNFIKYFLVLLLVFTCSFNFLIGQGTVRWEVSSTPTNTNVPTPVDLTTVGVSGNADSILYTGRINVTSDVYEMPHGKLIGQIERNQTVDIYKRSADNNWYCISFNGSKAYIVTSIVVLDKPAQSSNSPSGWQVSGQPTNQQTNTFPTPIDNPPTPVNNTPPPVNPPPTPAVVIETPNAPLPPPPVGQPNSTLMEVPGYTTAELLNVRTGPWGKKIGQLPYNTKIKIIGQDGDWYKVDYNGQTVYLHSKYVKTGIAPVVPYNGVSGNAQLGKNLVASAQSYIGSKDFRGKEVAYGRLACAQFVSTVLNDNNVIPVVLNVRSLVSKLKMKGWIEVTPPPYKDGDIVTWKTYDYTGDGVKDPDSHVGVVNVKSNGVYAIHNSSSRKYPRETNVNFGAPISRVLRAP